MMKQWSVWKRRMLAAAALAAVSPAVCGAECSGEASSGAADTAEVVTLRPVNSSFAATVGSSHLADTYLSPLKYAGVVAGLNYERLQAMKFNPEVWRQRLSVDLTYSSAKSPAKNSTMTGAVAAVSWGMLRRFVATPRWQVVVGLRADVHGGALYNSRNGNNPVDAIADVTLGVTGYAVCHTRLGRMPVMVRWLTDFPLTGVGFRQQYDELFYEIYLGNHHGLVHALWPGNLWRWDNQLTADLDFSSTRLRIGFRAEVLSECINHITTRTITWCGVIGATTDRLSLPAKGRPFPSPDNMRIIRAY